MDLDSVFDSPKSEHESGDSNLRGATSSKKVDTLMRIAKKLITLIDKDKTMSKSSSTMAALWSCESDKLYL